MRSELPAWAKRVISEPRFAPYVTVFNGNTPRAWNLYQWNVEVSEAFYGPLHCLEIALRNAEQDQLRARFGRPDWWHAAPLREHEQRKIAKAEADLRRKNVPRLTADDMVAELSFGFWISLLNRSYDRHLWVLALHRAFPHYSGNRETLRDGLQSVVLLRNRIMHHEPIHHRHLTADHTKIYRLLGYLEPEVAAWLRAFDRVQDVFARRPGGRQDASVRATS